ncbi:hypothetical protein P691DRAFT_616052, partial [Macrolepiota fuliginosa MF-IS2]
DCALYINLHGIALKHWKSVYIQGRQGQWGQLKNQWSNWKVVAAHWHQSSPTNFWDEFSENGWPMLYSCIVKRL